MKTEQFIVPDVQCRKLVTVIVNRQIIIHFQSDRSWERAWTLKEMRDGANNWSLAGDAGVSDIGLVSKVRYSDLHRIQVLLFLYELKV